MRLMSRVVLSLISAKDAPSFEQVDSHAAEANPADLVVLAQRDQFADIVPATDLIAHQYQNGRIMIEESVERQESLCHICPVWRYSEPVLVTAFHYNTILDLDYLARPDLSLYQVETYVRQVERRAFKFGALY